MIDNLLKYPSSCLVGKVIPKTTFQRHIDISANMKRHFQDDVVSITWLYKLAPTALQVQATEHMTEIEVFLAELKDPNCPSDLFTFIDKHMPQYLVFILQYQQQYRLLINYKEWADTAHTHFNITQSFCSEWLTLAQLSLPITGTELPTIYEHFVRHIAGQQLTTRGSVREDVQNLQQRDALLKEIKRTEKAIQNEAQFNKQVQLNQKLKKLRKQLQQL